jgi:hypothetical protein
MPQPHSHNHHHSRPGATIALLLPDLVDCAKDGDALRETLRTAPRQTRLLVCIPESPAEPTLRAVAGIDIDKQVLLGHDVEKVEGGAFFVKAPPRMSRDDLIEFALALSDVALVSAANKAERWAQYASKKLGKTLVAVGAPLHSLSDEAVDITKGLDPEVFGWHVWGRYLLGRFEQAVLELLALAPWWDGHKRKNRLLRSFAQWQPVSYFAPAHWQESCPDQAATSKHCHLVKSFAAMDRSALYGSYTHRDITWAAHFGVAFAVFFAVIGYVSGEASFPLFPALELASLAFSALVIWARLARLQDRWTACRFGAEQLRIARMSLPLLVLPPAFATTDAKPTNDRKVDYEFAALAQAKRAVREQGLPQVDYSSLPAVEAARWLKLIVDDQIRYHERNHVTLERAEITLNVVSAVVFVASIIAVALPLFIPALRHDPTVPPLLWPGYYLLLSAVGPALVAALHGAGTRLGFVHRAALSDDMKKQLAVIAQSVDALVKSADSSTKAWQEVRAQTYEAAKAMGAENSSWHRLVRRYRDELP